jgi:hypothetical protein
VELQGDGASNLHSYWEDLPGTECKIRSDRMPCVHRAVVFGKALRPVTQIAGRNTDTATWARDSFEYARTEVYKTPIGPADGPYTIVPWASYESQAYLAQKRIALAGSTLARV